MLQARYGPKEQRKPFPRVVRHELMGFGAHVARASHVDGEGSPRRHCSFPTGAKLVGPAWPARTKDEAWVVLFRTMSDYDY